MEQTEWQDADGTGADAQGQNPANSAGAASVVSGAFGIRLTRSE